MTTRTVQMFGLAYGSSPAELAVTLDGISVYTGTVATSDTPIPSMPNLSIVDSTVEFCNFEIPVEFDGTKPMICTVNNGTVIFAQTKVNYVPIQNPVFSESDLNIILNLSLPPSERVAVFASHAVPPFSAAEIAILESTDPVDQSAQLAIVTAHGVALQISSGSTGFYDINSGFEARANVVIDGTPVTPQHSSEYEGTWWWKLASGSTMTYNLVVDAGLE
jgi:hypothetical protein